jgi:hypothetical protein
MIETWFIFLTIILFSLPLSTSNSNDNKKKYEEEQSHRSSFLSPDVSQEGDKNNKPLRQVIKLNDESERIGEVRPDEERTK